MGNKIKDAIVKYKINNMMKNYKGDGIPKIDMHVHYVPKAYREELLNKVEGEPDGFPTPEWNPRDAFRDDETFRELQLQC